MLRKTEEEMILQNVFKILFLYKIAYLHIIFNILHCFCLWMTPGYLLIMGSVERFNLVFICHTDKVINPLILFPYIGWYTTALEQLAMGLRWAKDNFLWSSNLVIKLNHISVLLDFQASRSTKYVDFK